MKYLKYLWSSFQTISYWKYALFSKHAIKAFFTYLGGIWLFIELSDFFELVDQKEASISGLLWVIFSAVILVVLTRMPVSKIFYRIPSKDISIEVRIGDLFQIAGQKVINTNNTFDTDLASGLISIQSVQGQFTQKYYPGNVPKLDAELEHALTQYSSEVVPNPVGKGNRYDIGTTVKLQQGQEIFYLVAMAELNKNGTTETSLPIIRNSLIGLWSFISQHGEVGDIVIPLFGTGRGRLDVSRKKIIRIIARSFLAGSQGRIFSKKLIIVLRPEDVEESGLNLFEVKDYLYHSLD